MAYSINNKYNKILYVPTHDNKLTDFKYFGGYIIILECQKNSTIVVVVIGFVK